MEYIQGIKKVMPLYKAFFIDLWGVVHDGIKAYPGVVDCLNLLISSGKEVLFVSNSPRPSLLNYEKLKELGIHLLPQMVLTSGDLLRLHMATPESFLFKKLGPKFYYMGEERNKDLLSGLSLFPTSELEKANFVLFSSYTDPEEDITSYDSFLLKCLSLSLPFVCANPDREAVHGDKIRHCAGFFAHKYAEMGGQVHYYGKPYPLIYDMALEITSNKQIDKSQVLMIGDTLETDILGASQAGIESALVLSGNAGREAQTSSLEDVCGSKGIKPTWVLDSLRL